MIQDDLYIDPNKGSFWYESFSVLLKALALILIIIGIIFVTRAVWLQTDRAMDERADDVARCKSMGGEYGENNCYVNGESL